MIPIILVAFALSPWAMSAPKGPPDLKRANELKDYIQREKHQYESRETQKQNILEELDQVNQEQNKIRQKFFSLTQNHQELSMALENLAMEIEKQKDTERYQKQRFLGTLKILNKIRHEGLVRFLVMGSEKGQLSSRIRVLHYLLRSHTALSNQLTERANRLNQSEQKLNRAREEVGHLFSELKEQEQLLNGMLHKKKGVLALLAEKQHNYKATLKEYRKISKQISALFDNFEASRDSHDTIFPNLGSLPLPIDLGKIARNFGKAVHEKFQTITFRKGIEIEADHNTPVYAILPGVVEFEGWVKALGNVLILHHGGGFYSLNAHLFKSTKSQGNRVTQGETIGYVGDTGSNEKPSLYFEIRENGKAVDPVAYFSPSALSSLQ